MCVCELFSHIFWWQSNGSRRDVYFTLQCIQGTTLCSVFLCPSEPTGVIVDLYLGEAYRFAAETGETAAAVS